MSAPHWLETMEEAVNQAISYNNLNPMQAWGEVLDMAVQNFLELLREAREEIENQPKKG